MKCFAALALTIYMIPTVDEIMQNRVQNHHYSNNIQAVLLLKHAKTTRLSKQVPWGPLGRWMHFKTNPFEVCEVCDHGNACLLKGL